MTAGRQVVTKRKKSLGADFRRSAVAIPKLGADAARLRERRSARPGARRVRGPRGAGRPRRRRRQGARRRAAPARRGRHRYGQEPRVPRAGARFGPARRRGDGDQGPAAAAADEGRAARRRGARPRRERRRAEGAAELPVPKPAARLRAARRIAVRPPGGRPRVRRDAALDRLDRDRRPGRARDRAVARAVERAGGRIRPLPRADLPARRHVLLRGGARARVPRRPRDREPRALLRRSRRCASGATAPASCPSTRRSSSTRRTGSRRRRRRGSAAACRARACTASRATSTGPAAKGACPRRRGRSTASSGGRRPLRRRLPRSGACPPAAAAGERVPRSRGAPRRAGLGARRRERRARRARGPRAAGASRTCRRAPTRASSSASSGRSPTRSPGRPWTCPGRCASGSGTAGRPPCSSPPRWARGTTSPSCATGSACATPRSYASARLSGSTSRRSSISRRTCPTRGPRARSSGSRRRRLRSARSRRGRALVLTSSYRALDAIAPRLRDALPFDVLVQGEAPRERLLERFGREVDSVLVATATFWQGVDVPGEALSLLVIDKLPFPAPATRSSRRAASGSRPRAGTGSPTTRSPPPSSSCVRASAG